MQSSTEPTLSELVNNEIFIPQVADELAGHLTRDAGLSLIARLAAHATAWSGRIAIATPSGSLTFGELESRSNRLAHHLRSVGPTRGECLALLLDRSTDFIVAALAAMKACAAYLPIDASTPVARINHILSDSGAQQLITHQSKTATMAIECAAIVVDLDDRTTIASLTRQSIEPIAESPSANELAYIIYTSGSTGTPKGVELTHTNLLNLIDWHNRAFAVTEHDRASQVAGLGFDAAVWEIWPHLAAGATIHLADESIRRSAPALREWLIANKITISFVPTILAEQLLFGGWPKEASLRTMLTGADTLHRRPIDGLPFKLINNYGPSECTVVTTSGVVTSAAAGDEHSAPSIGRAIDNAHVFILDSDRNEVPIGEAGELCIAGALVGRGYRKNPAMTATKFTTFKSAAGKTHRIYRTGDRAKQLPSGEIAFLGRLDDQVKIRGYRVELGEIVASLDRCPGVDASAVLARPAVADDLTAGLELVAYVVASPTATLNAAEMNAFLAARVPDYMIPAKYVKLISMPMTANGKLDRAALPVPTASNLIGGGTSESEAPTAPSTGDMKVKLAEVVAGLLGVPQITNEQNFFMAGGHSMFGVQLVAKIKDAFGVKLSLRQLFGAPTIDMLSAVIAKLKA